MALPAVLAIIDILLGSNKDGEKQQVTQQQGYGNGQSQIPGGGEVGGKMWGKDQTIADASASTGQQQNSGGNAMNTIGNIYSLLNMGQGQQQNTAYQMPYLRERRS